MRTVTSVLLGMLSGCAHTPSAVPTAVVPPETRVPDFCCTAEDCCDVPYHDADGGVHVQPCRSRLELGANCPHADVQRAGSRNPFCPEETHWDGFACTHTRVTCGGWNGISCDKTADDPTEMERAAEIEFAAIAAEARTVCPEEDESNQAYTGTAPEIVRALDAAIAHADRISRRLREMREAQPTPRWMIATFAKSGGVFDCVWNSLRQSHPTYFTPQQQALLNRLNKVQQQLNQVYASGASQGQAQIANTQQLVIAKWNQTRDKYLAMLELRLVAEYVNAVLLARRYALEGSACARACQRLPAVVTILGDEKVGRLLESISDPTDPQPDPDKRRHLIYVAGAFNVAR